MRSIIAAAALVAISVIATRTDARPNRASPATARPRAQQAAQLPSVTLPGPLDRVLRDYEKAWRAGDAATLTALFADSGFVLQPGRAPGRGKEAIRTAYTGAGGGALRLRALAFASEGSVGVIIGAYSYGDDPADTGKFTLTLRRGAGERWLIMSDMDNASTR